MRWLLVNLLCISSVQAAGVAPEAWQYQREMVRSAQRIFGPNAPVATLAAQIHQESAWNIRAVSWAGAEGFAQFMPGTAADMARRFPGECAPADPFSPKWAFTCRDRYLATLLKASHTPGTSGCSDMAFALRSYNGGHGWTQKDRRLAAQSGANSDNWVEVEPFNAGRRVSAHRENREYPVRIFRLTPLYGEWGAGLVC